MSPSALLWPKELQLIGIIIAFVLCSTQTTYYITPTLNTQCPGEPCHTLSQYADQFFQNFSSDTTLVFLPGDHILNHTISIGTVPNYTDVLHQTFGKYFHYPHPTLTLIGNTSFLPEITSRIVCTWPGSFTFSGVSELYINALAFISCGNDDNAAVNIRSVWNTSMSNCTFRNNTNSLLQGGRHGGAIHVYNSSVTITGSIFQYNTAHWGGALDVWCNSTVTLSNNAFHNNFAEIGGALNVFNYSTLVLAENSFQSNSANYGAAISVHTRNTLTLSENTFQNNSADYDGGVLHTDTSNILNLSKNSFRNNCAQHGGGALLIYTNSTLNLSNNTFCNNSAGYGGAIVVDTNSTATISVSMFQNNYADYGGAVYVHVNNTLKLSENVFQNNCAGRAGGALHVYTNNILTLLKNTFRNNSADRVYGGAISAVVDNSLSLAKNTFQNNYADYGGAIFVHVNSTLNLSENVFRNNSAERAGGAIVYTGSILMLSKNTFRNNSASYGGALLINTNSSCTFLVNTFQNNFATYGGAIYVNANSTLNLVENLFQNNSAKRAGGVLIVYINSTLTISKNLFQNNVAGNRDAFPDTDSTLVNKVRTKYVYGGAIYTQVNNSLSLSGNRFQNNCAAYAGGGIFVKVNSTLTLSNNTFQNNSADYGGAIITDANNSCSFLANVFQNNSADSGGAIQVNVNSALNLSENVFQNNFASYGGAINVNVSNTLILAGNIFQSNSAGYGGALMVIKNSILVLSDNTFDKNYARFAGATLAIIMHSTLSLFRNMFRNNSAHHGGAVYVSQNSTLSLSENRFLGNSADIVGGALAAFINNTLTLSENIFANNSGGHYGGGALYVRQSTLHLNGDAFTGNRAQSSGGAILCLNSSILNVHESQRLWNNQAVHGGGIAALECDLQFSGIVFESNEAYFGGGLYTDQSQVSGQATFIKNVANTDGGGIFAAKSDFYCKTGTTFVGNSALNGGGLLLTDDSKLHLGPNTSIVFKSNYAVEKGGAIKVTESNPLGSCVEIPCEVLIGSDCFFQILTQSQYDIGINVSEIHELQNISVFFENNRALEAGATLYGGSVDSCSLMFINPELQGLGGFQLYRCPHSGIVFNKITNSGERPLDITSDPLFICACVGGEADCSVSSITKSVYPGGTIKVPVVAYGQRNATTPAVVHNITPTGEITIDGPENTQNTTKSCTLLRYTVQTHAVGTSQEMTLYVEGSCPPKERTAFSEPTNVIKLSIAVLHCPPGFQLSKSPPACICAQRLQPFTNTCLIEGRRIERNTNFWVGYEHDNTSDGLILHRHCPFDYCKPNKMYVTVEDSNSQCGNNRMGLLCGKCHQNFSLALGSSHCLQCSNRSLWLIVVFAFAGIGLVLLLLVLRLTVAVGTINGLVFYVNILAANLATFFQPQTTNILTVFIAWLNLDLGIETCFYNGMDAYIKLWLQYIFPFYLWFLVVVIIIVSHYSSKVATILGTNPIAVLATLFLLSYAKLLHTVIAALSYTLLEYPNNSQIAVWLYDGNITYLSGKHIPLFLVALVCLMVLFLPYTIFLILGQWLRTMSRWKIASWANNHRVLPFLEAYHAPYASKHRYWTGLMLLVRCILFLISAFNALGDPNVNLLAIASVTAVLIIVNGILGNKIYRNWYLNVLELSFIANMFILAIATLYINSAGGNQNAVAFTSISIAFATFIGIVIYHLIQQIKDTPKLRRRLFPQNDRYNPIPQTDEGSDLEGAVPPSPPDPSDGCATVTHINIRELLDLNLRELREPCMEMDN